LAFPQVKFSEQLDIFVKGSLDFSHQLFNLFPTDKATPARILLSNCVFLFSRFIEEVWGGYNSFAKIIFLILWTGGQVGPRFGGGSSILQPEMSIAVGISGQRRGQRMSVQTRVNRNQNVCAGICRFIGAWGHEWFIDKMSGWLMKVASPGSGEDTLDAAKKISLH